MADDWRDWFRSKLHPDQFAHPDSPAGGAGTGFARPPGPQRYSWSSLRVPHPDSPAGRHFDWQSELLRAEHQEHQGLTRQFEELERFLAKQSAIFRENLPDPSLKDIYDRQNDRTKTSGFGRSMDHGAAGTTPHLNALLQPLENHIQWFDTNSRDLPQRHDLRILLGTKQIAWEHGTLEEKRELLNQVRGFAGRFYEAATKSIQKQWADAKRAGRPEELIERWKRQLLQPPRIAYSGSGIGQTQREIEEQQRSKARPEKRPEPPLREMSQSERQSSVDRSLPLNNPGTRRFKVILENELGLPIPEAEYKIELADDSIITGKLGLDGTHWIENPPTGTVEISYPNYDDIKAKSLAARIHKACQEKNVGELHFVLGHSRPLLGATVAAYGQYFDSLSGKGMLEDIYAAISGGPLALATVILMARGGLPTRERITYHHWAEEAIG